MDVQQPADEIVAVAAPEVEKDLNPNSLFVGIGLAVVNRLDVAILTTLNTSDYALQS